MTVIDTFRKPERPHGRSVMGAVNVPPDVRELCHDLRQPAAALSILAATISEQPDIPAEVRARVDHLAREAERLRSMVHDVLARQQEQWEPVDVAELVRDVVASMRVTRATDITFSVDDVAFVLGRHVQLDRAISNLVDNAAHAVGIHGWVFVSVRVEADRVRVSVEDNGPGLLHADGMLSLGLLIVEGLVREHDGECVVSDLSPSGTRIEMSFRRLFGEDRAIRSL